MRTVAVAWTPSTERREPGGEAAAAAWPASREKLVAPCPASRRGTERPPPGRQVGLGGKWPASDLSVLDLDRLGSLARSQPQGTSMDGVVRMRTWTLTEDGAAGAIRLFRFFFWRGSGGLVKVLLLPLPTGDLSARSQSRAQLCGTDSAWTWRVGVVGTVCGSQSLTTGGAGAVCFFLHTHFNM